MAEPNSDAPKVVRPADVFWHLGTVVSRDQLIDGTTADTAPAHPDRTTDCSRPQRPVPEFSGAIRYGYVPVPYRTELPDSSGPVPSPSSNAGWRSVRWRHRIPTKVVKCSPRRQQIYEPRVDPALGIRSLLTTRSAKAHAERRKAWTQAMTPWSIENYEPLLKARVEQLVKSLDKRIEDGGGTATLDSGGPGSATLLLISWAIWQTKLCASSLPVPTGGARQIPADQDCYVGTWFIPGPTQIYAPPYAIHRRAVYFSDPDEFNPDRWSDNQPRAASPQSAHTVLLRTCRLGVGKALAWREMWTVAGTIIKRWTECLSFNSPRSQAPVSSPSSPSPASTETAPTSTRGLTGNRHVVLPTNSKGRRTAFASISGNDKSPAPPRETASPSSASAWYACPGYAPLLLPMPFVDRALADRVSISPSTASSVCNVEVTVNRRKMEFSRNLFDRIHLSPSSGTTTRTSSPRQWCIRAFQIPLQRTSLGIPSASAPSQTAPSIEPLRPKRAFEPVSPLLPLDTPPQSPRATTPGAAERDTGPRTSRAASKVTSSPSHAVYS
ncbi:hypothetical protein HMN09_01401600 [Mycena chlorophos]|uniref:Uncharacterized protein n=1 Tax=Mycena chlorophos TaxID=658473 RepID=A0A8H6RWT2_MYCCL|nr:hypothetical protein HMN09_01401600 [Mycena chlorophos]